MNKEQNQKPLVAIITDCHFGCRGDSPHFLNNQRKFFENTFFPSLVENGIDTVFDLGDTFDRRKYLNFKTLAMVNKMWFDLLRKHNINVISIIGNHQTYYKNTNDINSGELILDIHDNYKVFYEAEEITYAGKKILMMPWINTENRETSVQMINDTDADLLFGHLEINGYDVIPGHKYHSDHALDPGSLYKFRRVMSGHFHQKQSKQNVSYLGCPYELSYTDCNTNKGFHLYDFDTDDLTFVRNPYKIHYIVEYDDSVDGAHDKYTNWSVSDYTDSYVKIRVINKKDAYLYDKFIDLVESANPIKTIIQEHLADEGSTESLILDAQDTISILDSYVDDKYEDAKDNKKLKTLLKSLYLEATNDDIVV